MRFLQRLMHAISRALKLMSRPILDAAGRVIGWVTPSPDPTPADPVDLAEMEIADSRNSTAQTKKADPIAGIRHALLLIARGEPVPHDRLTGIRDTVKNQLRSMTRDHAKALLKVGDSDLERWLSTSMPPSVEIKRRRPKAAPALRSELGLVPVP